VEEAKELVKDGVEATKNLNSSAITNVILVILVALFASMSYNFHQRTKEIDSKVDKEVFELRIKNLEEKVTHLQEIYKLSNKKDEKLAEKIESMSRDISVIKVQLQK